MPTPKHRFLALLATGRISNLPAIWTSVLVGALLASPSALQFQISPLLLGCILASCLYAGGSFLGDASDARWDAEHQPDRPIPRGVLSSTRVAFAGYSLIAGGWFGGCVFKSMLWAIRSPAEVLPAVKSVTPHTLSGALFGLSYEQVALSTMLALGILIYGIYHRRLGYSAPILMALCRGLLALWAGSLTVSSFTDGPAEVGSFLNSLLPYTLCIVTYTTVVLSMVARSEFDPKVWVTAPLLQILLLLPPLGAVLFLASRLEGGRPNLVLVLATVAFLCWGIGSLVTLRRSVPAFASRALAGFCLLDALFAALFGWQAAAVCFALFLLALLLQRLVPAT